MRNAYSAFLLSGASALKIDIKSRKSSNDNFPSFLDENNSHNRSANGLYCKRMLFCLIYYKNNQFIIILKKQIEINFNYFKLWNIFAELCERYSFFFGFQIDGWIYTLENIVNTEKNMDLKRKVLLLKILVYLILTAIFLCVKDKSTPIRISQLIRIHTYN